MRDYHKKLVILSLMYLFSPSVIKRNSVTNHVNNTIELIVHGGAFFFFFTNTISLMMLVKLQVSKFYYIKRSHFIMMYNLLHFVFTIIQMFLFLTSYCILLNSVSSLLDLQVK